MSKLNLKAREAIEKALLEKKTYREIASEIGVSKSTVGYEVKNNTRFDRTYNAEHADWRSQELASSKNKKRWKNLQEELLDIIDKQLQKKISKRYFFIP